MNKDLVIIPELVGENLGGYIGTEELGYALCLGSKQKPWPEAVPIDVNGFDTSKLKPNTFYKLKIYKKLELSTEEEVNLNPTEEDDEDVSKVTYVLIEEPVEVDKADVRAAVKECEKSGEELWAREIVYRTNLKVQREKAYLKNVKIPEVPADLNIVANKWALLNASLQDKQNIMLLGLKGTGKTETAIQLAKANDAAFFAFNMGSAFKPKQLFVGQLHAKQNDDGNVETVLFESEFLKAFQAEELTYIFLDEITRTPAPAANYLMTITDLNQGYIYVEELGKRIYKGKGVRFIAAGNVGSQYVDTRTQDTAFWDRFAKLCLDYLSVEDETALLMRKVPGLTLKGASSLVKIANKTREACNDQQISNCLSFRQLMSGGSLLVRGFTLEKVIDEVLINNFINGNVDDRETAKTYLQSN